MIEPQTMIILLMVNVWGLIFTWKMERAKSHMTNEIERLKAELKERGTR